MPLDDVSRVAGSWRQRSGQEVLHEAAQWPQRSKTAVVGCVEIARCRPEHDDDQRAPGEVETKKEVGHWEGDLILGLRCRSAMMTLRERVTQYGIIVNLPLDHTSESVKDAVIKAFRGLPKRMRRRLTWDQGTVMCLHREITAALDLKIFFAERCSPWQRGANENFNGLARQYFPKGTDLSVHSLAHVRAVTRELNTRPRKTLDNATPATLFNAERRAVVHRHLSAVALAATPAETLSVSWDYPVFSSLVLQRQ